MYQSVPPKQSCAEAWVAACQVIMNDHDQGYNVVMDVADPVTHSEKDNEVITLVDNFLKLHDKYPIISVANTIFPQSLLDAHGPSEFYKIYHRDFANFSHGTRQWGRYFERMTRHVDKVGRESNPLQDLIDRMKAYKSKSKCVKAVYELPICPMDRDSEAEQSECQEITIYQPSKDQKRFPGGPCLSYLSFKWHPENLLLLTAVYRNHFYITRLLGNLIGLGRLQAFVSSQTGVPMGSLTVISTHAELDTGEWGIVEARELVNQGDAILRQK